jgi:hypothetical protein
LPPAELAVVRRDVHAGRRTFAGWLEELDLWVAADRIHYFARWLTPPGNTRRFDTRFLVAAAPPGQEAEPDGSELTEARWMTPADAATRHRAGAIDLVLPTRWALDLVGAYHSVAELLGAAGDGDLATAGIRHG